MEEYANYGFDYIEDKLVNDPNYYFRDIAFLTEITNMLKSPQTVEDKMNLMTKCLNLLIKGIIVMYINGKSIKFMINHI